MLPFKVTRLDAILTDMYVCKQVSKEEFLSLSYRKLREHTGIDIRHWSNWFNSKVAPNFDTMEKAAEDLGMPLMDFIEAFLERRKRTTHNGKESD